MGQNFAKLTGEIAKGIKIGESSIEVKLVFPLKAALPHLVFLSNNQGAEVNVILGDPQMSFDFEEEDMYKPYVGGRQVTADASGIVTSVQQSEAQEKDGNQAELFSELGAVPATSGGGDEEQKGKDSADPIGDNHPGREEELDDFEKGDNYQSSSGSDLPEWMQEADDNGDDAGTGEMDFENEGDTADTQEKDRDEEQQEAVADTASAAAVDPKELESFILRQQPTFEDIPYDFPELLRQRREEGKTWMDISKEIGVPSKQISSKYSVYKKRVAEMMQDGGAA
ncbi:hypothetical protein J2TS6_43730 [Paenibacillus albilobatus]|uniref:Uncharacterized protein n=1 Tax=Paenibacillus albilobatus TaxID=2716884 RepID=A0A919XM70_9BACL|nr:hypothetical protein [Paenibacillus albilobatus]GIO33232.1 hypothetical protein J2TS6_43730 [Paenibacillus albilobatus]